MSEEQIFNLSRGDFAKKLEITTDTLKKRMKRGHYKDLYIVKDGKYLFNGDERARPNIVNSPVTHVPRRRNRGNHLTSKNPKYTNQLKQHNELKMLAKLKHNVDPEIQQLLPDAIEIAKQKKREKLQKSLNKPIKLPYSNGIENMSKTHVQTLGLMPGNNQPRTITFRTNLKELNPSPKDEYEKYLEDNDLKPNTRKIYY